MAQNNNFDPFYISRLVIKMINGELTLTEQADLNEWLAANPKNNALVEKMLDKSLWDKEVKDMNAFDTDAALKLVLEKIDPEHQAPIRKRIWPALAKFAAAAVILLTVGAGIYLLNDQPFNQTKSQAKLREASITEENQVMLTLADGSKVDVNSVTNTSPIRQGTTVLTEENGSLNYQIDPDKATQSELLAYNTLAVPMGKQYQLTLPDGTEVWLNSHSSLKYPIAFSGKDRVVELTGEAYFEVAKLKGKPFKVKSNQQVIEVLGTHFNVEAYLEDNKTVTTLAEGAVNVTNTTSSTKIKPGQMAVNRLGDSQLLVKEANITTALAWKNGLFSFSDDRLEDIMRKVARSYNVEVEFQGDGQVKDKRFFGVYPRNKGLNNLLKNLAQTNTVHFKVNGRRIIVMP